MSPIRGLSRHPVSVLLAFLIVAAGLTAFVGRFEVNASADTLISEGNRLYIENRVVQQRFSPEEFMFVAYEPRQRSIFDPASLEDLRAMSSAIGKLDRVKSVRSLVNVPLIPADASIGLDSGFDPDDWTMESRHFSPQRLAQILSGHPIYEGLLVNRKQTATALQVLFKSNARLDELNRQITQIQAKRLDGKLGEDDEAALEDLKQQAAPIEKELRLQRADEVDAIRGIVAGYEDDANIYLGGVQVLGVDLIRMVRKDLKVFGIAVSVMIGIVLLLIFRRVLWVVLPLACCAVSVLMTVGLFGLLGLKATVISANFMALQLVLTLAIVVHLIVQYREEQAKDEAADVRSLVERTLREKIGPCLYAGLTTSVGFASLILCDIAPVCAFGLMMIVAMGVSILTSLILFPTAMLLLGRRDRAQSDRWTQRVTGALSGLALRRSGLTIFAGLALLGASIAGALLLDVENSFINYFKDSTRIHKELAFVDREMGGSTPLDVIYHLPDGGPKSGNLVLRAESVQMAQRIQAVLEQQPAMGTVLSIVNFTELARGLNGNRPLTETELTAVYWTLDDSLRKDLVGSYFSEDSGELRLSARIQDTTEGLDRGELLDTLHRQIEALGLDRDDYQLTSLLVLYEDLLERLFTSQELTLGVVFVVLGLAFWVIFGSLRVALIALVPNILSSLVVLGIMGWLRIPLDFMTITIASVAMGIAVDDTIHYVHRVRQEQKGGADMAEAIRRSHRSVGAALIYTTLILVLGFALLAFSDFVPTILFGLLSGTAMLVALIADLLLLPALLLRFGGKQPATST